MAHETVVAEMVALIETNGNTYRKYGVRCADDLLVVGEIAPNSYRHGDDLPEDALVMLDGTSALELPYHSDCDVDNVSDMVDAVVAYRRQYIVLLADDASNGTIEYGEDQGEIVMPWAKVLGIWERE